jgi:LysR family transcriptional regulator, transcriptional activator for dmlA
MERADLELVVAIHEAGSLAQAAAQLRLSAPVVTKRLAALETALGLKLFFRTTRRLSPTAEGDVLCERAIALLGQFAQTEEALRDHVREPAGPIRLAATLGFGRIWLGPAIAQFQAHHPAVRVQLQLTEKLPDLGADGYDGAVWLWSPNASRVSQWSARKLASNQRVLVASPGYLKHHPAPQTLAELAVHECLVVRESDDPSYTWQLSRARDKKVTAVRVQGSLSCNSGELVRDWCLGGRGIMLRSLWDVAPQIAAGTLVRVLQAYAMRDADIQWLAPFRAQTPKRVRLLSDFLHQTFHQAPWAVGSDLKPPPTPADAPGHCEPAPPAHNRLLSN